MSIFNSIVIILCIALLLLSVLHAVKLPSIIGYLALGVAFGPYGFGLIKDTHVTAELAEIGIVFLLFMIGLEFSVSKLIRLKRFVFLYGSLQVVLTLFITALAAKCFNLSSVQSLIIGAVASLSSTAIVSKLLTEQDELSLPHGQRAIGILLFQDLAVIPLMILITSLSSPDFNAVMSDIFWALIKGGLAIGFIIAISQWGVQPLFNMVAKSKSLELFTLTTLVVTLSAAWVTNFFGLSFALGAFLAGIMLGETEFRHQIAIDIRPFRDVMLGLFFISIGFLIDLRSIFAYWQWVGLFLLALIGLKFVIILLFSWRMKSEKLATAAQTALVLSQGGEFGLVLLNLALAKRLIPHEYAQVMLVGIFLSMMIAPVLIRNNLALIQRWMKFLPTRIVENGEHLPSLADECDIKDHILILGFGRVGHRIAQFSDKQAIPYLAVDSLIDRVKLASQEGYRVYFGDASHGDILRACKIERAKCIVISFYHPKLTQQIIQVVKKIAPHVSIVLRCFDESEVEKLYAMGADAVIPETIETSLMLAFHLLLKFEVPAQQAWNTIESIRRDSYDDYDWT